jgi:5-methylcytosine-specific restriction endonuclease McrA
MTYNDSITSMYCDNCEQEFPLTSEFFTQDRRFATGWRPNCNRCLRGLNPRHELISASMRRESLRLSSARRYEVSHIYWLQWAKANPDKMRAYSRNDLIRHRVRRNAYSAHRRALKLGSVSSFTAADIERQIKGQTDKRGRLHCWWCGEVIEKYHKDHVHPLSKSKRNDAGNIVISCASCNLRKNAKSPSEFNGRLL